MLHRSLKLQVIHNMADACKHVRDSDTQARQLYGQLFGYIVSLNSVSKENSEGTVSRATILLPGFPLEHITDSIVHGLQILSDVVTAPAA